MTKYFNLAMLILGGFCVYGIGESPHIPEQLKGLLQVCMTIWVAGGIFAWLFLYGTFGIKLKTNKTRSMTKWQRM